MVESYSVLTNYYKENKEWLNELGINEYSSLITAPFEALKNIHFRLKKLENIKQEKG